MRRDITRLFVVTLFTAAGMAQQDASKMARVTGRVVNQDGNPVSRANVKLLGKDNYIQTSDDNGGFVLDNVAPGPYALVAQRSGFAAQKYGAPAPFARDCPNAESVASRNLNALQASSLQQCAARAPGTMLSLAAGREMKDLTIKLTQFGSISGRLINRDGEPVPNWQVRVMKTGYDHGVRQLQGGGFGARTGPDGSFSVADLPPGRYYLYAADVTATLFAGLTGDRQGKAPPEADVATYYPSDLDASHAKPVDVTPGSELRGLDIVVRRERVNSIRGTVAAPADNGPLTDQLLSLTRKGVTGSILDQVQGRVRADGTFEFRNVQPGTYVVNGGQAFGNAGAAPPLFGPPQEVTVSSTDVEGVKLTLMSSGVDLMGAVTLEGGNRGSWPSILLLETGSNRGELANVDSGGAFRFPRKLAPARWVVNLNNMPPGLYIKSIQYGKQDGIHQPLDLTGGGNLDIVLSSKVATIAGSVKNAKGGAAAGVVVSVWPVIPEMIGGIKSASTDQDGRYEITNLGPGDYFVAAWEDVDPGLLQSPEFADRFQNEAVAIKLGEGERGSADARLIPRERVASEVAKLP